MDTQENSVQSEELQMDYSIEKSSSYVLEESQSFDQAEEIDPNCTYSIKNRLVRIQYPGVVRNLDKAFETLGGLSGIERAVSVVPNRLVLNYHPENKYSKGCVAECNSNTGILLKIIVYNTVNGPLKHKYEIIGGTVRNFIFSKLIDFQYLPLVADYPEKKESKLDFIHEEIFPKEIPSLKSVLEEKANMTLFLPPMAFSRSDAQRKLGPIEKRLMNKYDQNKPTSLPKIKKQCRLFSKQEQPSIFHKFIQPDIPKKPTEFVKLLVTKKNYDVYIDKLENLFEERPIWTKSGLKYKSNISDDVLKIILPAVAYYELTGPWRCCWIKFGYDPRKDPQSRKYQTLDYRVPNFSKLNLKIGTKKSNITKLTNRSLETLTLIEDRISKPSSDENRFILRPNMIPPYRQIFYQYCDILLPEVETMLARLPPVAPYVKCNSKNGWFPSTFIDQCREIMNKYIDDQASKELLNPKRKETTSGKFSTEPKSTDYSSLLIRNVKRGLYKGSQTLNSKVADEPSTSFDISETASVTEIQDTDSDESIYDEFDDNFYHEYDAENEVEIENTDGDMIITADQETLNIDVEALEDVKNIIANTR